MPKIKKYSLPTNTVDAASTSLNALSGPLETVRLRPQRGSNHIMMLLADTNQALYSVMWNGVTNIVYNDQTDRRLIQHPTLGISDSVFWYDFAWEMY